LPDAQIEKFRIPAFLMNAILIRNSLYQFFRDKFIGALWIDMIIANNPPAPKEINISTAGLRLKKSGEKNNHIIVPTVKDKPDIAASCGMSIE
tara:strand:+ start:231 stop:509 length:279 start_codon:yes stop_codon:yes gene_type:complete